MVRVILGAVAGVVLGAALALPGWHFAGTIEYAELRRLDQARGVAEEEGLNRADVLRTSQLVCFAILTAGFGGTIGSVLGAASAVLGAVKSRDSEVE